MDFRILGPLEVARDGQPLKLGAVQQRGLLAVLVLRCGEVVSIDRLVDELWGERARRPRRRPCRCISPSCVRRWAPG